MNCLNGCRLEQSVTPDLFFIAYDLDLLVKQSENIALPHLSPKHVSGAQEFQVIKHQLAVHLGCYFPPPLIIKAPHRTLDECICWIPNCIGLRE